MNINKEKHKNLYLQGLSRLELWNTGNKMNKKILKIETSRI